MEFNEFEPRFKSAKPRFKFSAGLNHKTFDTILSETTIFEPRLKFFKFGLAGCTDKEHMQIRA